LSTFDSEYRCLAIRRVNPFLGVIQLVATQHARAVSHDGRRWEIQVCAERPADLWGGQGTQPEKGLFRFGVWSAEAGLTQVPVNPILNNGAIIPAARHLLGVLERTHRQTPFPLLDRLECWLLDKVGLPLALIATALSESERSPRPVPAAWLAAPGQTPARLRDYVRGLEARVAEAAGGPPLSRWFHRESGGTGLPLPEQGNSPAPQAAFPEVLFRDPEPPAEADAEAYLAWLAPRLLTLEGLSDATRGRLEHLARRHAVELAALWQLYPKIVHPELITSARVEAGIRLAAPDPHTTQ